LDDIPKFRVGCIPDRSLFMIPAGKESFPKNTWLQLFSLEPYPALKIITEKFKKAVKIRDQLSDLTMRQIVNCLKQCRDVEGDYLKLILDTKKSSSKK